MPRHTTTDPHERAMDIADREAEEAYMVDCTTFYHTWLDTYASALKNLPQVRSLRIVRHRRQ